MTNPSASVGNVPLEGHAVVEGPAGNLTLDWTTYGNRSDVRIMGGGVPADVVAGDEGHLRTIGWTLRQLGEGLEAKGSQFSFVADVRPGRPNPLVEGVVHVAGLTERSRFTQLRTKVAADQAAVAGGGQLPDIRDLTLAEEWEAFASLHHSTLAPLTLRSETTMAGMERLQQDPTAPSVKLLGAFDPADPASLVAGATYLVTANALGAPPIGELATVAVRSDWQRRGLGAALVSTVLARFASEGARTALTYVDGENTAALGLFAAAGFKERGTRVYYGFA